MQIELYLKLQKCRKLKAKVRNARRESKCLNVHGFLEEL